MTVALGIDIEAAAPALPHLGKTAEVRSIDAPKTGRMSLTEGTENSAPLGSSSFRSQWQVLLADLGTPSNGKEIAAQADVPLSEADGQGGKLQSANPLPVEKLVKKQGQVNLLLQSSVDDAQTAVSTTKDKDKDTEAKKSALSTHKSTTGKKHVEVESAKKADAATQSATAGPVQLFLATPAPVTVASSSAVKTSKSSLHAHDVIASNRSEPNNGLAQHDAIPISLDAHESITIATGDELHTEKKPTPPSPVEQSGDSTATSDKGAQSAPATDGPGTGSGQRQIQNAVLTAQTDAAHNAASEPTALSQAGTQFPLRSEEAVPKHSTEKLSHVSGEAQPILQSSVAPQPAHTSVIPAVSAAHVSPDTTVAPNSVSNTAGHESVGLAPSVHETFSALDSSTGTPVWVHAGPHRAEAGFQDPTLGWVGVRADSVGGGAVHASLVAGSTDAAQSLSMHLAGLNAYMAERHTQINNVTLTTADNGAAGWSAHSSMSQDGQSGSQGQEQSSSQANVAHTQWNISAAGGRQTSVAMPQTTEHLAVQPNYGGASMHISVVA